MPARNRGRFCREYGRKRQAFSLIELLFVISIICFLCSLLTPVFMTVRANSRKIACASNLRQLGNAIAMYSQDYDDLYPMGADPVDKNTNIWGRSPDFLLLVGTMPLLRDVLSPYIKNEALWRCPSDTGYDELDSNLRPDQPVYLVARPTSYERFGTSYLYRTSLALMQKPYGSSVYELFPPYTEHGTAELIVLMDGNGSWHGGAQYTQKRYNVLMGDGHVVNQSFEQNQRSWGLQLDPGNFIPGRE